MCRAAGPAQEFIPYGRQRRALMCTWLPLLLKPCLTERRGMLGLEFAHYKQRMIQGWEPGPHNTIGRLARKCVACVCVCACIVRAHVYVRVCVRACEWVCVRAYVRCREAP